MVKGKVLAAYLLLLAVAATWPVFGVRQAEHGRRVDPDTLRWVPPNAVLRQRPLDAVEQRFARHFPGRIDRYGDAGGGWIVRAVDRPTRLLHPAADCFRGLGYTVTPARVRTADDGERWSCFSAHRDGRRLQVCERLFDRGAGRWTDVSAWYWSALLGGTGPWWAVTRVSRE